MTLQAYDIPGATMNTSPIRLSYVLTQMAQEILALTACLGEDEKTKAFLTHLRRKLGSLAAFGSEFASWTTSKEKTPEKHGPNGENQGM